MKTTTVCTLKSLLIDDIIFKNYISSKYKFDDYDEFEQETDIDLEKLKIENNLNLYYYRYLVKTINERSRNNFFIILKKFMNNNSNEEFDLNHIFKNIYNALCYIYMVQYYFL